MSATINAATLQRLFLAGAKRIEAKKEYINELNVFPVPDGDTGTNMSLTIMSAAKDVQAIEDPTMATIAKAMSSGSLRGARGNSGVILSQLFRGFCKDIQDKEELGVEDIMSGFKRAVETAYKAVMKPKEGTILTVAKGVCDKAQELGPRAKDLDVYFKAILDYGYEVLSKTPDMLPVLKEAGVVDSGGQGLMEVLHGAYDEFVGNEVDYKVDIPVVKKEKAKLISAVDSKNITTANIKFGYCTEFIVVLDKAIDDNTKDKFREYLLSMGDSLVFVSDDEMIKVHVHTNHPGEVFEKAFTYGQLCNMKIDNMRMEHQEKLQKEHERMAKMMQEERNGIIRHAETAPKPYDEDLIEEDKKEAEPPKKYGFISVSVGDGMNDIFGELNVDYIISGGQTMNPSTEDVLEAIASVNAENIFILPNNKNIILAANQAKSLTKDKNIIVLPTKTVPQGISAMIGFNPESTPEENEAAMSEAFSLVKSGEVTYAVRDTSIDGKEIHVGDYMGIGDNGIEAVGKDKQETTIELISKISDEDSELVSIYYGSEATEAEANELSEKLSELLPDADVEVYYGGQPVYYYIISVE
ncbi:MAG: DAK2 domain-containing protein [Lachnospiraceae bacterium]|nr:DAK2 domain-containing protein [Lachnospiraceae bacterium]